MTDLNAHYDATERDALAWRMLEEQLDMLEVADLEFLKENAREYPRVGDVLRALHDALAYRRQT